MRGKILSQNYSKYENILFKKKLKCYLFEARTLFKYIWVISSFFFHKTAITGNPGNSGKRVIPDSFSFDVYFIDRY